MAIKKSELYSSLWQSCDELRGGMDASQYKDYVLVLLFVKYVSDKYAGDEDALIEVPEGGSFADLVALKGDKEIGDKINKIIGRLAEANDLKGIIDVADFNNEDKLGKGKEMQDRLSNLVAIFNKPELNFGKNRADGDDILGDAYEYLMRHFATESGKSKGQFYTPAEVSRVMAQVIEIEGVKRQDKTIYDPTCGSGSLLIKAADETEGITIYGQEMDNATRALAKMNMILHGHPTAEVWQDNTLSTPHFKDGEHLKTFDFAVANPPFSSKSWRNGFNPEEDIYNRFAGYGIPPAKNGDYAFLLHLIRSLKSKGKGAIILPHGVLFRGNVEAEIRTNILKKGYIKGIIGLPANLFYGTGIPACIIVIDKENADKRDRLSSASEGIFIIDASKGFTKDGNKNRLRERDIHKIVDVFNKQLELPKYSRLVPLEEIASNEYNLNIPRYIDSQEAEDIQDIEAHLLGGIPNRDIDDLKRYWAVYPGLRKELFTSIAREGYSELKIAQDEIKQTIFNHPEFVSYSEKIDNIIQSWCDRHVSLLKDLSPATKPKELIFQLSEAILEAFSETNLINKYDVFQHLMIYWTETMKDDVYFIIEEGWTAQPYAILDKKGKPKKDEWDCDLIPKPLVINRYFADEQSKIEQLEAETEAITRDKEEMEEEHSGEDGFLEEVKNDKGKITKGNVQTRIKELQQELDWGEELTVLKNYLALFDKEAAADKKVKAAQKKLDKLLLEQYKKLTEAEVKTLVVDDKWLATISQEIKTELDRISQRLTQRIKELAERYEQTLPELTTRVEELESKVNKYLQQLKIDNG
ncbi:class I SAM-dependent DNA methyltransferase [Myxosarcina sp. GI1]|uniref:type I restriction-modification system subunit M n=1 Tax=Myxosarcina sp. GI1 TaxID=1541065 RepID=UPI000560F18E|nr:class I SAM-dependent DNA methyltransferase [Myxosarcina sp. GI1]